MNLQESIRRILREETELTTYFRRRINCFNEFIDKLENGNIKVPIIPRNRLNWIDYRIILTAYIRNYCGDNDYYDPEIHQKILDIYEDRLYQWYLKNIPE